MQNEKKFKSDKIRTVQKSSAIVLFDNLRFKMFNFQDRNKKKENSFVSFFPTVDWNTGLLISFIQCEDQILPELFYSMWKNLSNLSSVAWISISMSKWSFHVKQYKLM